MEFGKRRLTEIITLIFALYVTLSETQHKETDTELSDFACISTSSAINESIVNESFGRTFSKLHCGMRCSSLSALSFYFEDITSTCHCNDETDGAAELDTINKGIQYCTLINRTGTPSECQALYDVGFRYTKAYSIGPDNIPIYCDMSALGWTVFQRRQDGSVDFYRKWADYVNGFGDENGEFWMGLEEIHQRTVNGCELHIYLEAEPNSTVQDSGYARYSNFTLGSVGTFYTLIAEGFSGNVGDGLIWSTGMAFSTYDVDHDQVGYSCSQTYQTGWWLSTCFKGNLNGIYIVGPQANYAQGLTWNYPWGYYYSLRRTEMAFRCDAEPRV